MQKVPEAAPGSVKRRLFRVFFGGGYIALRGALKVMGGILRKTDNWKHIIQAPLFYA